MLDIGMDSYKLIPCYIPEIMDFTMFHQFWQDINVCPHIRISGVFISSARCFVRFNFIIFLHIVFQLLHINYTIAMQIQVQMPAEHFVCIPFVSV